VKKLIEMQAGGVPRFLQHLSRPDRVAISRICRRSKRRRFLALINPQLVVGGELLVTRVLRDITAERQLEAVMTDFWLNHFNVYLKKGEFASWYLADYQNKVIRPHAMGKFEDLAGGDRAESGHAFYLDQTESVGPHSLAAWRSQMGLNGPAAKARTVGLNENYARELMELHTLASMADTRSATYGSREDFHRLGDRSPSRAGSLCSTRGATSQDKRLRWDTSSLITASRRACRFCICWR